MFISQHTCKTFRQWEQENWNVKKNKNEAAVYWHVTHAGLSELMWSDTLVEMQANLFQETDDWRTSKTLQKHFKSGVSTCCPLVCTVFLLLRPEAVSVFIWKLNYRSNVGEKKKKHLICNNLFEFKIKPIWPWLQQRTFLKYSMPQSWKL